MGFWFRLQLVPAWITAAIASRLQAAFRPAMIVISALILLSAAILTLRSGFV